MPDSTATKYCRGCQQVKPVTEFSRDRRARDGLYARCKQCDKARSRRDYAAHTAERRARRRAYNAEHAGDLRRYFQDYYQANALEIRARERQYRTRHPDQIAAKKAVQRAVKAGLMIRPTALPCAICRTPATEYHHYAGYAPEHQLTVVALCRSCHRRAHGAADGSASPAHLVTSPGGNHVHNKLSRAERETNINMTADDRSMWVVYSNDPWFWRRMAKLGVAPAEILAYEVHVYRLDTRNVSFRRIMQLSDEERAHRAAAAQNARGGSDTATDLQGFEPGNGQL